MKNIITLNLIIIFTTIFYNLAYTQSGCNLNLPENMEVITLSNIVANDINYENKHIVIGAVGGNPVPLKGNAKFTNCRITLNKMLTYDWGKKMEFYQCEIHFENGTALRFSGNWAESFAEIIFEGNCISGNNTAELLHVNDGGLRFVNNNLSINSFAHIFHIYNPSPYFDNSFYGNNITNTSSENQGIISMANTTIANFKIGDNSQAKNIFLNVNNKIINELGPNNRNLIIENSEFSSNSYGITIGPSISVDNCKFQSASNNVVGIGIQADQGISCTNSTFNKLEIGVHTKQNNFTAINSTFTNNNLGIKVSKSSTNGVGEIKNNNFSSNNIDVFVTGSFNQLEVSRNNFSGREFGFLADGDNNYTLENNAFYNSYAGNIAYANGSNSNFARNNQYNTLIGMHALEDNNMFQFTDNCYSTAGGDVYLDGSVSDVIGSESAEANNLFTKGGVPDISAFTNPFEYFRNDLSIGREDPVTSGTYIEVNADIKDNPVCGSEQPFSVTVRRYCTINFKHTTCKQAKDMLAAIDKDIADVNSSIAYREKVKISILKSLKNCRLKLLSFLKTCIDPAPNDPRFPEGEISTSAWTGNEPQQASITLKTSTDKYERAEYISTMISMRNFSEVSQYLENYSAEDEEDADFNAVQKINVARYLSANEYVTTENDIYILQQAALKPYPLAGYARGLYTQLTGNIIMPPIPRIAFNRTSKGTSDKGLFNMMPNPMGDQLTISVTANMQSSEIRISDLTGKTYYHNVLLENKVDISTEYWPAGIYFVVCTNDQGIGECKKLVKQ